MYLLGPFVFFYKTILPLTFNIIKSWWHERYSQKLCCWHPWSALIYAPWCEVQSGLYMQHIGICQAPKLFFIPNGNWNSYIRDLPWRLLRTNTLNTKINRNLEFALWFRGLIHLDILHISLRVGTLKTNGSLLLVRSGLWLLWCYKSFILSVAVELRYSAHAR